MSLPPIVITTAVSSGVVTAKSSAIGGSLIALTVIVTVAIALSKAPSFTLK
jgi:hypothetical protein